MKIAFFMQTCLTINLFFYEFDSLFFRAFEKQKWSNSKIVFEVIEVKSCYKSTEVIPVVDAAIWPSSLFWRLNPIREWGSLRTIETTNVIFLLWVNFSSFNIFFNTDLIWIGLQFLNKYIFSFETRQLGNLCILLAGKTIFRWLRFSGAIFIYF